MENHPTYEQLQETNKQLLQQIADQKFNFQQQIDILQLKLEAKQDFINLMNPTEYEFSELECSLSERNTSNSDNFTCFKDQIDLQQQLENDLLMLQEDEKSEVLVSQLLESLNSRLQLLESQQDGLEESQALIKSQELTAQMLE